MGIKICKGTTRHILGPHARPFFQKVKRDAIQNRYVYVMLLPVVAYYFIFHYIPMYGAQIAFKDYSPSLGIIGSPWIGLQNFIDFFSSYYFWRILWNTLILNILDIIFDFPAPIILALLLNEIRNKAFKRTVQTITYLPHFISLVVICSIILDFLSRDGIINYALKLLGIGPIPFMTRPEWFRFVFVSTNIWQSIGWGSIVYLAALAGINPELYEAAKIDGANRWRQTWSVTIPSIIPTIVIMFILRIGKIMDINMEKVLLLYNPTIYETADVISTFVYRKGLLEANYSFSAAVELFNSIINFSLLVLVNKLSRRVSESSLW